MSVFRLLEPQLASHSKMIWHPELDNSTACSSHNCVTIQLVIQFEVNSHPKDRQFQPRRMSIYLTTSQQTKPALREKHPPQTKKTYTFHLKEFPRSAWQVDTINTPGNSATQSKWQPSALVWPSAKLIMLKHKLEIIPSQTRTRCFFENSNRVPSW